MLTIIWLIAWLIEDTPALEGDALWGGSEWAVALGICLVLDLANAIIDTSRS